VLADVAGHPGFLEDRLGIVLDLEDAEAGLLDLLRHVAGAAVEPGLDVIHPADEERDARRLPHRGEADARFVAAPGQAERDAGARL